MIYILVKDMVGSSKSYNKGILVGYNCGCLFANKLDSGDVYCDKREFEDYLYHSKDKFI